MTINAGVWIDHHKAVVVLLTDDGEDMLQIRAEEVASAGTSGVARLVHAAMRNDFVAERKRESKVMAQLNDYYDQVVACVRNAQAILILGPGKANGEFRSRIATRNYRGHVVEMKTVARLTDQQISDYVRQHFQ